MKHLAFAVGVLALSFAACAPARADFAVVKFELGYCRIWWDTGAKLDWHGLRTIVATAPTFEGAWAAQDAAVKKGTCK